MINEQQARDLVGRELLERDGHRVGEIGGVFVDERTGQPSWVTVKTGWFGMSSSFIPVASLHATDNTLRTAFDSATIKDAPRHDPDRPLTPADEDRLRAHYGQFDPRAVIPADHRAPGNGTTSTPTATISVRVCPDCGAWVEREMADRHAAYHMALAHPAGNYARHDIQDTETDMAMSPTPRPPGNYARHDIQVTEPATPDTRSRQLLYR